jgi:hypothetical protein
VSGQKRVLAQKKEAITPSQVQPPNHKQRACCLREKHARVSRTNLRTKHSKLKEKIARADHKCAPPITERIRINTTRTLFSDSGHNFQLPEGFGDHEDLDNNVTDDMIVTGKLNWGTNFVKQYIPECIKPTYAIDATTLLRTTATGQATIAASKARETAMKRKSSIQEKTANNDQQKRQRQQQQVKRSILGATEVGFGKISQQGSNHEEQERTQAPTLVRTFIQSTKPAVDLEYQRTLMQQLEQKMSGPNWPLYEQGLMFESAVGLDTEKNTLLSRYEQVYTNIALGVLGM